MVNLKRLSFEEIIKRIRKEIRKAYKGHKVSVKQQYYGKITIDNIKKQGKTYIEILKEYVQNKYDTNKVSPRTHIRKVFPNLTIYSNNSIDKIYRLISKTFKIAVSDRIIPFNPMENESITKPKSDIPNKEIEALTQ